MLWKVDHVVLGGWIPTDDVVFILSTATIRRCFGWGRESKAKHRRSGTRSGFVPIPAVSSARCLTFLFWTASSVKSVSRSNRACGIDYRRQQGAAYVTIIARAYLAYIYPCKKLLSSRLQLSLYKHKTFRMISDGVGVIVRSAEAARQGRSMPGTDT